MGGGGGFDGGGKKLSASSGVHTTYVQPSPLFIQLLRIRISNSLVSVFRMRRFLFAWASWVPRRALRMLTYADVC